MKGWVVTRDAKDGSKRYDACWRIGSRLKSKTFLRKKEADRYLTTVVQAVQAGTYREIKPITLRQYADLWLEGLGNLKPSTRSAYASMLQQQLIPAFGDSVLTRLGVEDVNAYLASREGVLKPKTLRNLLGLLHKLFEDAREGGYLAVNRLSRSRALRRPRALREGDEGEVDILDVDEVNRLLDAVDPHYLPLFVTAVSTGMRLGELLALQWGDVDWEAKVVRVRRSVYKGEFYVPKSRRSRRSVDLGDQLVATLRSLRRTRFGETSPAAGDLVFATPDGTLIDPDNLRHRVWAPALAKAGLRHVVIHSLRHTYASLLIAQGENIKYISSQLGHASVQITLDRYGHLFPNEKRMAAARLEQQLGRAVSSPHPAEPAWPPLNGSDRAGNGTGARADEP